MASAVHRLFSPLPDLSDLKSRSSKRDTYGALGAGDAVSGAQTPTSSGDPASERIDPVVLLSRPVEGFNHPRQHLFTDRLLGRFYEDSSLDAETRKTSKCLAGRLGTAVSNTTTRPSTTATATPHARSTHSPTTTRRGGKRMYGSASAQALGNSREPGRAGLAARKEQVQKEILEQKVLIEELEGRVASLSGGGGRRERGATSHRRQGTEGRPASMPEPESVVAGQRIGDDEFVGDAYGSAVQNQSPTDCGGVGDHNHRGSGRARAGGQSRGKDKQAEDHVRNTRRDSLRFSSQGAVRAVPLGQQREEESAVTIQRNVRGIGRRKRFLTLQFAREKFEHKLQTLVSAAETALAQPQHRQDQQSNAASGTGGGCGGKVNGISTAAARLLETSREDGLAKPPFEILRAMYHGMDDVTRALTSFSMAAAQEEKAREQALEGSGAKMGGMLGATSMTESCDAAKEALDAIREAVGADIMVVTKRAHFPAPSAASPPTVLRVHQQSPAGSGRAAAIAMGSTRGGLLVSPEDSPMTHRESVGRQSRNAVDEARKNGGQVDHGEKYPPESVPLRLLDVEQVAQLLRSHGFEEHIPGFVTQAVDGVMLSDPNLCEADFAELGLGGGGVEGAHDCRARMVLFFRQCQQIGVTFPVAEDSPLSFGGRLGPQTDSRHTRDSTLDERPRNESSTVRKGEMEAEGDSPRETGRARETSREESSWRRGSALVDRRNQHVIAQISFDPSETVRADAATSTGSGNGRQMSVKLNQGVVVTAGGREAGLVVTEELPTIDAGDGALAAAASAGKEEEGEEEVAAATTGSETFPTTNRRRRESLGLPTVTLYKEPSGGRVSETAEEMPLPPGVPVMAANATVNVFR